MARNVPIEVELITQPFDRPALGEVIAGELDSGRWTRFRAAVAFLKRSGFKQLAGPLDSFLSRSGSEVTIAVGIDHDGTSLEGLQDLWRLIGGRGRLLVFKEGQGGQARTFHPKVYAFETGARGRVIIGSGNLTAGGLFTNHEASLSVAFERDRAEGRAFHAGIDAALKHWQEPGPACREVDAALLRALWASGEVISESAIGAGRRAARSATRTGRLARTAGRSALFGPSGASELPPTPAPLPPMAPAVVSPSPGGGAQRPTRSGGAGAVGTHQALLIEVRPHQNGEVFLSKLAVNEDPGFFGFPFSGWTTPKKATNRPYPMVSPDPRVEIVVYDAAGTARTRLGHPLNVVFYSPKAEIRITIPPEPLARIPDFSMLVMTRNPSAAYDYRLEFFPPTCTTPRVLAFRRRLTRSMPAGGAPRARRYGWM